MTENSFIRNTPKGERGSRKIKGRQVTANQPKIEPELLILVEAKSEKDGLVYREPSIYRDFYT